MAQILGLQGARATVPQDLKKSTMKELNVGKVIVKDVGEADSL